MESTNLNIASRALLGVEVSQCKGKIANASQSSLARELLLSQHIHAENNMVAKHR
jgi:hypothetical protein